MLFIHVLQNFFTHLHTYFIYIFIPLSFNTSVNITPCRIYRGHPAETCLPIQRPGPGLRSPGAWSLRSSSRGIWVIGTYSTYCSNRTHRLKSFKLAAFWCNFWKDVLKVAAERVFRLSMNFQTATSHHPQYVILLCWDNWTKQYSFYLVPWVCTLVGVGDLTKWPYPFHTVIGFFINFCDFLCKIPTCIANSPVYSRHRHGSYIIAN